MGDINLWLTVESEMGNRKGSLIFQDEILLKKRKKKEVEYGL